MNAPARKNASLDGGELPAIARGIAEVRDAIQKARRRGCTIGFVPTMGALHAGHVSLIDAAKRDGHFVVVSIYVNPTQFGPKEDLAAYPRSFDADREACAKAGVDLIFAPTDAEVYPPGDQTRVKPGRLAETMCGPLRPGHFEGVCTIVAKLFNIVSPDTAYFGQKDAQQALIIKKMAADLRFPLRIEVCPTVREADGLAMSSRNAYLSREERARALCLFRALSLGRQRLLEGQRDVGSIIEGMREEIGRIAGPETVIDYVVVVNAETLAPMDAPDGSLLLGGAVRIGKTRLIDNLVVNV